MVRLKHVWPILLALMVAPRCFAQEPKADPQITVDVDVTCEVVAPAQCKGGAGFHISADGTLRTRPRGQSIGQPRLPARAWLALSFPGCRKPSRFPTVPAVSNCMGSAGNWIRDAAGRVHPPMIFFDSPTK